MFINPKIAIEKGWITSEIPFSEKNVQPNAIDFTVDEVKQLVHSTPAALSEESKTMRRLIDVPLNGDNWLLKQGLVYDGTSKMYVNLPDGVAALLFTRSTLTRNGVFLCSGLYDSGFKGHIGYTIYPIGGDIRLFVGTRVGQIAFVESDAAKLYSGGWNHEAGTHYTGEPNDN